MDTAELRHTFAGRIRKLRDGRELNQGQFADSVGISRGAMSYYEQEARTPDIGVLRSICEKCGVSADYLIGLMPDPNRAVSDVCRETSLSPEAARKLRVISRVLAFPPGVATLEQYKDVFGEGFSDAMNMLPFTSLPEVLNVLLENDEGLNVLILLGAIILGAEIDTGGEREPVVKVKSAAKGVEIAFPLENLAAALWVNIQNDVAGLRNKLQNPTPEPE
jgi:transcriptional regulator with XRE-family HTH domain